MRGYEINWRDGTISSYESIWSIIRKYSYLNRVGKSVSKTDLLGKKYRQIEVPALFSYDINTTLLSHLVGGTAIDIQTAWLSPYMLSNQIIGYELNQNSINLRYCPECMLRGYHSPIHQLPWVTCCPIHQSLLHEACPKCKKTISLDSWIDPCGKHDASRDTCHCGYELWPSFRSYCWPTGWGKEDTRPIGAYLRWLSSISLSPQAIAAKEGLLGLRACNVTQELQTELFSFWRYMCPPPPSVARFLGGVAVIRKQVINLNLTPSGADALIELVRSVGYRGLSEAFIINQTRKNIRLPYLYGARRLVNNIGFRHRHCKHQKGMLKKKYQFSLGVLSIFNVEYEYFCPRNNLLELLSNLWIGLWNENSPRQFLAQYVNLRNPSHGYVQSMMVTLGLADLDYHEAESGHIPTWHPEIVRLFSHLTNSLWEAAMSALCDNYLKFEFAHDRNSRIVSDDCALPKMPYVIAERSNAGGVKIVIFKRNNVIVTNQFLRISWDAHKISPSEYFECLHKKYLEEQGRELNKLVEYNKTNIFGRDAD